MNKSEHLLYNAGANPCQYADVSDFKEFQLPNGGWRTSFTARLDLFRQDWFHLDGTTPNSVQLLRVPCMDYNSVFGGDLTSLITVTPPRIEPEVLKQTRLGINGCAGRIALVTRDDRSTSAIVFDFDLMCMPQNKKSAFSKVLASFSLV
jgi:hypothetical protein